MLFRAMLLLEGMALLLFATRYAKTSAEFTRHLVIMLVVGAVATAVLTFVTVAGDFAETRRPATTVTGILRARPMERFISSDVNAAGSYFAMMAFLALGMGFKEREWRWAWLAQGRAPSHHVDDADRGRRRGGRRTSSEFWSSRELRLSHSSYRVRAVSAACVVLAVGTAFFLVFRTTGATPSVAVGIRWVFLRTTARMLLAEPAFGVGIGQYARRRRRFAPPGVVPLWRPDNAHNNLAQIAGELGTRRPHHAFLRCWLRRSGFDPTLRAAGHFRTSDRRPRQRLY